MDLTGYGDEVELEFANPEFYADEVPKDVMEYINALEGVVMDAVSVVRNPENTYHLAQSIEELTNLAKRMNGDEEDEK